MVTVASNNTAGGDCSRPRMRTGHTAIMSRCADCGAERCDELFETLLALDHSRQEPWGPLHGVVAPCYFLQHSARSADSSWSVYWSMLRAYLAGGTAALDAMTNQLRALNSHRKGGLGPESVADVPVKSPPLHGFVVTIAEVAVDGTFPAEGYEDRVREWAEATAAAWRD